MNEDAKVPSAFTVFFGPLIVSCSLNMFSLLLSFFQMLTCLFPCTRFWSFLALWKEDAQMQLQYNMLTSCLGTRGLDYSLIEEGLLA